MEYQVQLQFFQDDATGGYGLAHRNSIDKGFNAFFSSIGVFHDVMEHYFEDVHPNFCGKYAFNYGGEIAASGHSAWYIHGLGLSRRWTDLKAHYGIEDVFTRSVGLEDEIVTGYNNFGNELLCKCRNVYRSHPNYSGFIYYHWDYWQRLIERYPEPKDQIQNAILMRRSLSLRKLEALYGWGYYTAKKLFPLTDHNVDMIEKMYEDIERFVSYNNAEELAHMFKYFNAYITPGKAFKYRFTVSQGPYEFDAMDSNKWFEDEQY